MRDKIDKTKILLVEDSPSLATVYQAYLNGENYRVTLATKGAAALELLSQDVPDVVLLDIKLPDMSGMDILRSIHQRGLSCSVIIITAHGSVDTAIEAMRHGAVDFISKPFDAARLRVTLKNVLEKRHLTHMVDSLQKTFQRESFHGFIGTSLAMQATYRIIESAASSKATVFVTGESGTGKELCAEALHLESPRRNEPFITINCAAIPRELMESEVFGHVKGAFTGAASNRDGAASRADGGTLFLDEICEMNLDLQSKLLRFIQTGTFQKVGNSKEDAVDVRFVCATNRDPIEEVRAKRFREDLYYRLNVIPVHLPPLREREGDILLIAGEFLSRMAKEESKTFRGFSPAVARSFQSYSWPGNVRELENVIRNIAVLNDGQNVSLEMIPRQMMQGDIQAALEKETIESVADSLLSTQSNTIIPDSRDVEEIRPLWIKEKEIIERAIELCEGNVPKAAALLEISASTVYRKRQTWGQQTAEGV